MLLADLIQSSGLLPEVAEGTDLAIDVRGVTADSRRVQPGFVFVAVSGARHRGVDFVPAATAAGAVAVVVDELPEAETFAAWSVPVIKVSKARAAVGPLCAAALGHPSRQLCVVGVTGTNGKTTTTVLIAQLLGAAGYRAAALGTLGVWTAQGIVAGSLTTPDAEDLQATLAQLRDQGVTHVAMEVSSHALDQERVAGVAFAAAAWTNLSRDHLDYHGTEDRYAAAKGLLFSRYGIAKNRAFVNGDDPRACQPRDRGQAQAWSFGPSPSAEHQLLGLRCDARGLSMTLRTEGQPDLAVAAPLIGRHNAENLAAALLIVRSLGVTPVVLQQACKVLQAPRGRLEPVANSSGALVVVDYAHTPDALQKVLGALRPLVAPGRRLVVVFGCGGDRDPGKRPQMGQIAGQMAEFTVVTSDNPRSESPAAIADAIVAGLVKAGAVAVTLPTTGRVQTLGVRRGYWVQIDRAEAIRRAIALVGPGDVLCIAGKGHETTQTAAGHARHFDDAQEAARWLGSTAAAAVDAAPRPEAGFAFDADRAARVTDGRIIVPGTGRTQVLCTDSRSVADGGLFVALPGEKFDGGLYVGDALAKGARGIVCAVGRGAGHSAFAQQRGAWIVEVDDPLRALGDLARDYRGRFAAVTVGITGSNGKTTTKELTALALSPFGAARGGSVLATQGNHNNRVGVPQTLARLLPEHRAAVVEMGMSVPGEIAELARMGQPKVGIVTSIAEAHLLGMGTVEAIADEKFDLIRALPQDGVAVLPKAEPLLVALSQEVSCRIIWFGRDAGDVRLAGPVQATGLDSSTPSQRFEAWVGDRRVTVSLPGLGVHLAHNALAALAAAWALGVDPQAAADALQGYRPVGQRMLPSRVGAWLVLEDCYNANPRSTETALDTLAGLPGPRAAILGSMLELGASERELHARVGAHAARCGVDLLLAVGPMADAYLAGARGAGLSAAVACADQQQAAVELERRQATGTVLIKGSRGARMELVLAALQDRAQRPATSTPAAAAATGGC